MYLPLQLHAYLSRSVLRLDAAVIMLPIKGKLIELNEIGFVLDDGSRIETKNNEQLDLAVGEEVSFIGIPLEGGNILAAAISVYRSGQWVRVENNLPSSISRFINKSEDIEANNRLDTFQSINSVSVSVDHSKNGGTSIRHFEQLADGTQRLIVADAFPRQPPPEQKSRVLLIVVVSCVIGLLTLIGAILFRFMLQ